MIFLLLAVVCSGAYVLFRRRDRRMLRNGVFLLAAAFFGVLGVANVAAAQFPAVELVIVGAILLVPIGVAVLAGFLVANGVRMFRREGRSFGNALSLAAGAGLFALVITVFVLVRSDSTVARDVLLLLLAVSGYGGAVYLVFLIYALVYGHVRHTPEADVVIVLGSGLISGAVTPLLRSRLDAAVSVYRHSRQRGRNTVLIPSGGQGADEPRSEGAAMAEYLVQQGIPSSHVFPEVRSRNTEENLEYSVAVQRDAGVGGRVLAVTSNYHVMRAAMLARSLGIDADVIGAPTAAYYVPSAFIREFVAVIVSHKVLHIVALVTVILFWVAVVGRQLF